MTAAAALAAITSSEQVEFGLIGMVGVAVWLIGFGFEVVADNQKRQFNQQQNSQQAFIQNGLWSRSRHPNYFGEILLWFGVAIVAFPVLQGWQYITLISPLFVAALLIKVSGIPQQEKQAKDQALNEEKKQQLEKKEQSIEGIVKPLSQVLEKYHNHVNEIEKERQKSYGSIESELKRVIESTVSLSSETLALKNALKSPFSSQKKCQIHDLGVCPQMPPTPGQLKNHNPIK